MIVIRCRRWMGMTYSWGTWLNWIQTRMLGQLTKTFRQNPHATSYATWVSPSPFWVGSDYASHLPDNVQHIIWVWYSGPEVHLSRHTCSNLKQVSMPQFMYNNCLWDAWCPRYVHNILVKPPLMCTFYGKVPGVFILFRIV